MWQVRRQLGQMYCPDTPNSCPEVDTGGYKVITTLDMNMQRTAEKWVYVAARATHAKDPLAILSSRKIPKADRTWILGLRGHNINNAAAAVTDYRTGEVLAYVGSASYTSKGNKKFQPQFDVLADGWRQPGSAIKPIDYAIGIDDKTLTASTMIMDVTTNFGGGFIPTQADKLERGPVRLREALQFSLNIPAIKATIEQGLDHTYDRTKDFGLSYPKTAVPVLSMGIGTLEVHPIDLLGAYGTIANGGVMMPRRVINQIIDSSGKVDLAAGRRRAQGHAGHQPRGGLRHHRHPGRQHRQEGQPVLGQVGHLRRQEPATGRLQDRHHQRQPRRRRVRLRRPTGRQERAGHRGRGLDGQQRQHAQRRQALAGHLRAALVGHHARGHQGREDRAVQAAQGHPDRDRRRLHRPQARTVHDQDGSPNTSSRARSRAQKETLRVAASIDAASGLLWQDGCQGPKVTRGFFNLSDVESNFPAWQRANAAWAARAARGSGRSRRTEGHPNRLLL